jgi:hypothetical protein
MMNWEGCGKDCRGLMRDSSSISLEALRKTQKAPVRIVSVTRNQASLEYTQKHRHWSRLARSEELPVANKSYIVLTPWLCGRQRSVAL